MEKITKINVAGQTFDIQDARVDNALIDIENITNKTASLYALADISEADKFTYLMPSAVYIVNGRELLLFENTGFKTGEFRQTWIQSGKILYRENIKELSSGMNFDSSIWSEWKEIGGSTTKVDWTSDMNLNNFTEDGDYEIVGSREQDWKDSMPIISGGKLHAKLTVYTNGEYTSQFIRFDNIGGGDCNLYTRVCQNGVWENWQKLQGNVEVNAIGYGQEKTFDDLTDSGMYSGVNIINDNYDYYQETFVLVVINDILFGGGVTQLKYALDTTGGERKTVIKTRLKAQGGDWSDWTNVGGGNESIHISGAGTFSIDGDKYKTVFLSSVGPGTGYYNIIATKSTIIDVVLLDVAANYLHFDVNNSGRYTATKSYQAGMYRLAIDMSSNTLIVSTISNDANTNKF